MDTLSSMKVFKEVAELGSFVRTAEKLRLSPAMTSKHVQQLEDHLGTRLFHRTSRRVSLTDEGRFYYARCREILAEIEETEGALSQASAQAKGLLRVAAPVWMCDEAFAGALCAYRELYPEVELELELGDRAIDLVEDGIDLALRVTSEPHETLLARRICEVPLILAASPDYLDQHGRPQSPDELVAHRMLVNRSQSQSHAYMLTYATPNGPRQLSLKTVMSSNNTSLLAQSAACGMGIVLLPELLLRQPALATRLERVLPDLRLPADFYLYVVYTSRRFQSPKVRTFIDFIVAFFRALPAGT